MPDGDVKEFLRVAELRANLAIGSADRQVVGLACDVLALIQIVESLTNEREEGNA